MPLRSCAPRSSRSNSCPTCRRRGCGEAHRFERDRVLAKPTENLAAYEYVLRGREHFSRATRDSNDEAQDMFQRAIDLDPNYAAAYAELGLSLIEAVASGWTQFIADDLARAETLAQKALSLDSASTTAYRLLAEVHLAKRRFDLALGQIDRALVINLSDAESFSMRGAILLWAGRAAEALPGLKALFALIAPMPERPFLSVRPTISLAGTASLSEQWIMPFPEVSDVTPKLRAGLFWRPPTHSWIDGRTPNESGLQ